MGKCDITLDMLQRVFVNSRHLLSAYGLSTACQKSAVFQRFARQGLGAPLAVADVDVASMPVSMKRAKEVDDTDVDNSPTTPRKGKDNWLGPDTDPSTPEIFKH